MTEPAGALLALWNDVDPALEADYNAWHAHEHVPERCRVPGILWGLRYRHIAGIGMPRYLTLYGLRDPQVLDSDAYQRLLHEPTPMSRAMRPALRKLSRWVCRLHPGDVDWAHRTLDVQTRSGPAAEAHASRDRLQRAPGVRACLLAERIAAADPLPWLASGQSRGIEGDWLLCVGRDGHSASASPPGEGSSRYAALAPLAAG